MTTTPNEGDTVTMGGDDVEVLAAVANGDEDEDSSSTSSDASPTHTTTTTTTTTCLPPNHIAPDGTFIHLPPPTDAERIRFFERAIAEHGLLQEDLQESSKTKETGESNNDDDKKKADTKAEKIHPLAMASARLQTNGINELNRAINLHTLVANTDYFALSNIVDPSLEALGATTNEGGDNKTNADKSKTESDNAPKPTAAPAPAAKTSTADQEEEARTKATYILKRKRFQFEQAATTLRRHGQRLTAAIVAQTRPDTRLRQLRPVWRLVAPEHGTRALPHATLPTELVAADVDVYDNRHVGRLASRVPRYATLELQEDYKVETDEDEWKKRHCLQAKKENDNDNNNDDAMDVDELEEEKSDTTETATNVGIKKKDSPTPDNDDKMEQEKDTTTATLDSPEKKPKISGTSSLPTRAEPFAIADPSLGKIDTDFDPKKVVMLTLQFDIEKPSTGFFQSACLEPMLSYSEDQEQQEDEQLLVALQHSLFCAKLFEAVRRELAPDTEEIGQVRVTAAVQTQSAVWLSGESEENFLPPPSLMMNNNSNTNNQQQAGAATGGGQAQETSGLAPLCVAHVHEGDVKVLLDCEYSLRVRLVESSSASISSSRVRPEEGKGMEQPNSDASSAKTNTSSNSGSQSPGQLLFLCRALLLHAQETYHRHSVETETKLRKEQEEEQKRLEKLQKENPRMKIVPPVRSKEPATSPRILQSCVCLGTKMLFERRIRKTLRKVNDWLNKTVSPEANLQIDWLSLSLFDLSAQFHVSFRSWCIDASIEGDALTVVRFGAAGNLQKGTFHSDREFELYLKLALQRVCNM